MICPKCKSEMIVVEYRQIELDHCLGCQGVWFDSGELELLLDSAGTESGRLLLGNIRDAGEARVSERQRKCPICVQKMKKITLGQQPAILVDVCRQGHGLWFDGGELGHLIGQIKVTEKSGSQQEMVSFLQEVFQSPK
ncbi:MAG: hypothetical protein HW402_1243 [Dehalococcoidales bacterium]|nr:hypothetical protein [Dehalococcoidales bacterium]